MRANAILCLLISFTTPAVGHVQPRCFASRDVVLAFGGGDGVARVETWVTNDDGQSWAPAQVERVNDGSVEFTALRDGRFGFYLVLENEVGRSAEPPTAGDTPQISVIVDTAPPTLQVTRATARPAAGGTCNDLRLTLIEENLGPGGLRLFYRTQPGDPWTDGGTLQAQAPLMNAAETLLPWSMPPGLADKIDLLLVCTDRAGNTVREEVSAVPVRAPSTIAERNAAESHKSAATQPSVDAVGHAALAKLREAGSQAPGDVAKAEQMRALASRFLADGRMDLAAARFSDALAETPNDPQLLTEYGAALVRSNRLEDARQRFESALAAAPKNTAALEGLALVALGQQRLPDARDTLKRALDIDGGAGRVWLRYGDVEYRMGNQAAAFDAWKKAGAMTGDAQLQATARERLKSLQK